MPSPWLSLDAVHALSVRWWSNKENDMDPLKAAEQAQAESKHSESVGEQIGAFFKRLEEIVAGGARPEYATGGVVNPIRVVQFGDAGNADGASVYDQPLVERPEWENVRAEVLGEAELCVNGDRNADYGDPNQDFQRTATFWNTYLQGIAERKLASLALAAGERDEVLDFLAELIDSWDVGHMMTLLKISRSTVTPAKLDHMIDAAGYQACAADCVTA